MNVFKDYYADKFPEVFKSIIIANRAEFADFTAFEKSGTKICYSHSYSLWKGPVSEWTNRGFRRFVHKGRSPDDYTKDEILSLSDVINDIPGKGLGYRTYT